MPDNLRKKIQVTERENIGQFNPLVILILAII